MSVYEDWLKLAYSNDGTVDKRLWDKYLPLEQAVYEELLSTKTNAAEGTVSELAERFKMPPEYVCGFIDGVNSALDEEIEVKELEADSHVRISFGFERLYKKMVEYKAEHLYNLPQWDNVLEAAHRRELYYEQKKSGTVVKGVQPGRNDPCPCGSGRKYKKCCGA